MLVSKWFNNLLIFLLSFISKCLYTLCMLEDMFDPNHKQWTFTIVLLVDH